MKIKILYDDLRGNAINMSNLVATEIRERSEHIPPAFPPSGLRLLFIGLEVKGGKLSKKVKEFLPILTSERAENVAIFTCGTKQDVAQKAVREILEGNGIKVLDTTFTTAGVKGKGAVPTEEDLENLKSFAKVAVDQVYNR